MTTSAKEILCPKHNKVNLFNDECSECEVEKMKKESNDDVWLVVAHVHTRINRLSSKNLELERSVKMLAKLQKAAEKKNISLKKLLDDKYAN